MKQTGYTTILSTILLFTLILALTIACEKKVTSKKTTQTTSNQNASTTPTPAAKPGEKHNLTPTPEPKPEKLIYRVYPDETNPNQYVDLVEFRTVCPEPIGNLFGTGYLTINPTLPEERKVPLERVVSITFNKRGLVKHPIEGVKKIFEPVGYRQSKVVLRNPDEIIEGDPEDINPVIIVLCRQLEGKTVDGADWSLELKREKSKKFHKIELIRK